MIENENTTVTPPTAEATDSSKESVTPLPSQLFYANGEEFNMDKFDKFKNNKFLPTFTNEQLENYKKLIDEHIMENDSINNRSLDYVLKKLNESITPNDIGHRDNYDSLTHVVKTKNKEELKLRHLDLNKRAKSSKSALLKLTNKLSIGKHVQIPLWNSGFWITLSPFNNEEIIALEFEITNEFNRVGKETNTLIFSNYEALFIEVLVKHFRPKIIMSSLSISDDDDYFNYISLKDMPIIATAAAGTLHPKGLNITFPCTNTTKVKDGKPDCDMLINKHIFLEDLHIVDESKLDMIHIDHMGKKQPNSHTPEDVTKYQETLYTSEESNIKVPTADGDSITINIGFPMINTYIYSGRLFINELREKTTNLIKSNTDVTNEEVAENMIVKSIYIQMFNSFIKSIDIEDSTITELDELSEALDKLSSNEDSTELIINGINKFIDNSLFSYIGIPNFICSKCNEKQHDKEFIPLELIPISVYSYFFTLLHSKYVVIAKRLGHQNTK